MINDQGGGTRPFVLAYNAAMRKLLVFLWLVLEIHSGHAQEQIGIAHSNYAGTDAVAFNPARMAGQWPYMDIRFVGADVFAWNNLVALSGNDRSLFGEIRNGIQGTPNNALTVRESLSRSNKKALVNLGVEAPAITLSLGRGTIGVGLRTRSFVSITDVSPELGRFIYNGLGFEPQRNVRYDEGGPRVLASAWSEAALSYAHIIRAQGFGMLSMGATARYMMGHGGAALALHEFGYTLSDPSRLEVHAVSGAYGLAMPGPNVGRGFGGDLGVVYERTIDEADGYMPHRSARGCTPLPYRYRIGLSVLDLGGIRYQDAVAGSFSTGAIVIPDHNEVAVNGQEDLDSLFSTVTTHEPTSDLRIGSPTAIALQYDQRIQHQVYVALAAVQQVSSPTGFRLRRTNQISITPRFESRYVEVALPVVVREYDLRRPGLGFMLRSHSIIIGTDNILPLVGKRDVYSADVYFRIKWTFFRGPFCKGKRPGKARVAPGGREAIPCAQP